MVNRWLKSKVFQNTDLVWATQGVNWHLSRLCDEQLCFLSVRRVDIKLVSGLLSRCCPIFCGLILCLHQPGQNLARTHSSFHSSSELHKWLCGSCCGTDAFFPLWDCQEEDAGTERSCYWYFVIGACCRSLGQAWPGDHECRFVSLTRKLQRFCFRLLGFWVGFWVDLGVFLSEFFFSVWKLLLKVCC